VPGRDPVAAQAHDRQPPRHPRVRQPEAADDARGGGAALPRQPRREDPRVHPRDPRRPVPRAELDAGPPEPRPPAVQGRRARRPRRQRDRRLRPRPRWRGPIPPASRPSAMRPRITICGVLGLVVFVALGLAAIRSASVYWITAASWVVMTWLSVALL